MAGTVINGRIATGKRVALYMHLLLAELRKRREQIKRDQMGGIYTKGGNLTLNEFFRAVHEHEEEHQRQYTMVTINRTGKTPLLPVPRGIIEDFRNKTDPRKETVCGFTGKGIFTWNDQGHITLYYQMSAGSKRF